MHRWTFFILLVALTAFAEPSPVERPQFISGTRFTRCTTVLGAQGFDNSVWRINPFPYRSTVFEITDRLAARHGVTPSDSVFPQLGTGVAWKRREYPNVASAWFFATEANHRLAIWAEDDADPWYKSAANEGKPLHGLAQVSQSPTSGRIEYTTPLKYQRVGQPWTETIAFRDPAGGDDLRKTARELLARREKAFAAQVTKTEGKTLVARFFDWAPLMVELQQNTSLDVRSRGWSMSAISAELLESYILTELWMDAAGRVTPLSYLFVLTGNLRFSTRFGHFVSSLISHLDEGPRYTSLTIGVHALELSPKAPPLGTVFDGKILNVSFLSYGWPNTD